MDNYKHFYVDKTTQPFADALVAFGLARILAELVDQNDPLIIYDRGRYFELVCSEPIDIEYLTKQTIPIPIPLIKTVKNAESLPADAPSIDYEAVKEDRNRYFNERKNNPDAQKPHMHWDIFRAINPAALPGYINLLTQWWELRDDPNLILLLLDLFSSTPNSVEQAIERWKELDKELGWNIKPEATCQQLYNPDQGKGQNKTKSNGLSIGNVKNFWLIEFLKMVGLYEGGITKQVKGGKDRKSFVINPKEISFSQNTAIINAFYERMQVSETSTRFDILSATRYTIALLEHMQSNQTRLAHLLKLRNPKRKIVSGFHTAFYKDLGNAVATMNVSFIALPGWVEITNKDDIVVYISLLEELERVTRQFDEKNSDAFTLLQYLRDFVSGDDLNAFFRFTNLFPAYFMSMKERNKYAYSLSTTFVERLIMSTEARLTKILKSEGFQNIAYAIRQSTVTAQYRKKQGDRKYDVRYGLGQELARKSRYPGEFITQLSDFLHKYNAENAQIMETRPKPYRKSIKTSDIDEIVELIDEFGSEIVANMLIAYGYARIPHENDSEEIQDINDQEETEDED